MIVKSPDGTDEQDVVLGTDGEGRPTAELTVSLDIGYLNDQYNWLLSIATVYQAINEPDPKSRRGAPIPDTLEGLMNMLEDIRERIEGCGDETA